MNKIMIMHGPNLNMLGIREPEKYGTLTLNKVNALLRNKAKSLGVELAIVQSNSEGVLVDAIHTALNNVNFMIVNAAAYTHSSISIRDALLSVSIPFIEIHISNVYTREKYRHLSLLSDIAVGVISGFGTMGYVYALEAACEFMQSNTKLDIT